MTYQFSVDGLYGRRQNLKGGAMNYLNGRLETLCADITTIDADAIVNAANPSLRRRLEMASRIHPLMEIKRDPLGEKNYLSFFSKILYDTPFREKTCA
jgi:hypothetical protein